MDVTGACYARLVEAFRDRVDSPLLGAGGFGADTLKTGGKIFAMLVRGKLVVKLPRSRVERLVETGEGAPFESAPGRRMKEWVTIESESLAEWLPVAQEAFEFVAAQPRSPRKKLG